MGLYEQYIKENKRWGGERRGRGGRERVRLREVKEESILLDSFA